MLEYVTAFLMVTLAAALLGFTGAAVGAAALAKVVFWVFLILSVGSLALHLGRGGHLWGYQRHR